MTEHLSPQQTREFRAGQRKRNIVILAAIVLWVAAMFALTLVKTRITIDTRMQENQTQIPAHE